MIGAVSLNLPDREMFQLKESYRAMMAEAARSGLTLKDLEVREGWEMFKELCKESYLRSVLRKHGHPFN